MNQNLNNQPQCYEEDEIDLKELFKTLLKNKKLIIITTFIITFLALIYVYVKTPIYEVKANIQLGYMQDEKNKKTLVDTPASVVQTLKVIYNVDDKPKVKKFVSEISSIDTNKKVKDFIKITANGISNDEALKKLKEAVGYLQKRYEPKIEQYKTNQQAKIENLNLQLQKINKVTIPELQRKIEKVKTQTVPKIDEKIKLLQEQDIKKLQQQIKLLKTIDLAKIDEKINFYETSMIPSLKQKISLYETKLTEYNAAIKELYRSKSKIKDSAMLTILSVQMVNYQNLILNVENNIKDLKVKIDKINSETIPDLKDKKEKISTVTIKNLELQIDNIKNVQIKDLQIQKENLLKDKVWLIENKLTIDIPNKKQQLQQKIKALKYSLNDTNVQNSHVVGDYILKDYPAKPKKKLIIIVAFITGLILSIFLVFFLEFVKSFKEEEK